jgi:CheY-like chemotaxis protein
MMPNLRVVVVDGRPESVLFLTEYLLREGLRVETSRSAPEALEIVGRRRRANDPIDLVICNALLPKQDGVALLRDLRGRQENVEFALYAQFADFDPALYHEAERLGCSMFLDTPIDLSRVGYLLQKVKNRKRSGNSSEQPFFGTARISRPTSAGTSHYMHNAATERTPAVGNPNLQPPVTTAVPSTTFHSNLPSTNTVVRPDPVGSTSRIRRSVTGRVQVDQPATPQTDSRRRVLCAACMKEFMVAARPESFTINCLHCGQLNRVDPKK